jgi:hypothetical protein
MLFSRLYLMFGLVFRGEQARLVLALHHQVLILQSQLDKRPSLLPSVRVPIRRRVKSLPVQCSDDHPWSLMRHVPIGADVAHSVVGLGGLSGQARALTSARHATGECPLITGLWQHEAWVLGSPVLSSAGCK